MLPLYYVEKLTPKVTINCFHINSISFRRIAVNRYESCLIGTVGLGKLVPLVEKAIQNMHFSISLVDYAISAHFDSLSTIFHIKKVSIRFVSSL
jgi:hypothetical protein